MGAVAAYAEAPRVSIDPDVRVDTTHRTAADCAQEIVGLVRSRAAAQPLT